MEPPQARIAKPGRPISTSEGLFDERSQGDWRLDYRVFHQPGNGLCCCWRIRGIVLLVLRVIISEFSGARLKRGVGGVTGLLCGDDVGGAGCGRAAAVNGFLRRFCASTSAAGLFRIPALGTELPLVRHPEASSTIDPEGGEKCG